MKKNVIREKSFGFALRIVNLSQFLCDKKEYVMSKQILRSGTSIGALVREAEHAESKLDFIHKMAIAQKEANETDYWIDLLHESDFIDKKMHISMKNDIDEIQRLLTSIITSAKKKLSS